MKIPKNSGKFFFSFTHKNPIFGKILEKLFFINYFYYYFSEKKVIMIQVVNKKKLQNKKHKIIKRLKELNILPNSSESLTNEQKEIIIRLNSFDFSDWEKIKVDNGWTPKEKMDVNQVYFREKRKSVRSYLRNENILPKYGEPLTEEQQKIIDEIEKNDFTYYEIYKKEKRTQLYQNKVKQEKIPTEPKKQTEEKKKDLPPEYKASSLPKAVFQRLRMCEILPPLGFEMNETQKMIVNDVNENWLGKTKTHFIIKYLEYSTPRGRLLYRLYKKHTDYGFNFNLTHEDILIPDICPLLEIPLSTDPKDFKKDNYFTGDRIDSSKGYVKGNVQVISLLANKMKNKATENELIKFATNGLKILYNVK